MGGSAWKTQPMAEDASPLNCCLAGEETTPAVSAQGIAATRARLSLIARRAVAGRGLAAPESGAPTGIAFETFPGGGEPSAVKSDFCSARVFAMGAGVTAGLFMPRTFAVRWTSPCRTAVDHRLFPSAHGLDKMRLARSSRP
jgi:hypothetical protein